MIVPTAALMALEHRDRRRRRTALRAVPTRRRRSARPGGLPAGGPAAMKLIVHGAGLVGLWCLLWGDLSVANVISGSAVAALLMVAYPTGVRPVHGMSGVRPLALVRLVVYVLYEFAVSNALVARAVLSRESKMRTGIVACPLRTTLGEHDHVPRQRPRVEPRHAAGGGVARPARDPPPRPAAARRRRPPAERRDAGVARAAGVRQPRRPGPPRPIRACGRRTSRRAGDDPVHADDHGHVPHPDRSRRAVRVPLARRPDARRPRQRAERAPDRRDRRHRRPRPSTRDEARSCPWWWSWRSSASSAPPWSLASSRAGADDRRSCCSWAAQSSRCWRPSAWSASTTSTSGCMR